MMPILVKSDDNGLNMAWSVSHKIKIIYYKHLENTPKKIPMLTGYKLCFYNLMETQKQREFRFW